MSAGPSRFTRPEEDEEDVGSLLFMRGASSRSSQVS
jgi:hypothetical protein